jgi:hypothetical protein
VLIETLSGPFRKAKATNATDTSFPSRIPTLTEPSGDGVHNLAQDGQGLAQNRAVIVPYALGDDDDVFALRIIGWRAVGTGPTRLWIPVILGELTCTVSTAIGIAGAEVLNTERFADTLAIVTGGNGDWIDVNSPTGNIIAFATVNLHGFQKVEFTFDATTGDPTSMNALVAFN